MFSCQGQCSQDLSASLGQELVHGGLLTNLLLAITKVGVLVQAVNRLLMWGSVVPASGGNFQYWARSTLPLHFPSLCTA